MQSRIQSYLQNDSPEQRSELTRRAAVGLLGLVLGLFIGWVVWPVEGSVSSLSDLPPEMQAQYISAVADAYVATGGQNAEATLARLAGLDDPEAALADAIRFYEASLDPADNIRQVNLRTLATAIQAGDQVTRASGEDTGLLTQSSSLDEPEIGWLNWILVALTAILLLVGGIWIGVQVVRQSADEEEDADEEAAPQLAPTRDLSPEPDFAMATAPSSAPDQADQLSTWRAMLGEERHTATTAEVAEAEDEEPDIDNDEPARWSSSPAAKPPIVLEVDKTPVPAPEDVWDLSEGDDEEDEEDGAENEAEVEELIFPLEPEEWEAVDEAEDAPEVSADEETHTSEDELDEDEWEEEEFPAPPLPPPARPVPSASEQPRSAAPSRGAETPKPDPGRSGTFQGMLNNFWRKEQGGRPEDLVAEYIAHYRYGIPDYDESFTITATDKEGDLRGACGMGIHKDLDPQAASGDEVRLLDVWFYDRDDFRSYNQLLISRGLDSERLADKFTSSGTVTGEPLVAEPGVTFRLNGKNLVLVCQVVEVINLDGYPDGPAPFQSVKVAMTVQRKRG